MSISEKQIKNFYENYAESKGCNTKRAVKRYFDKRDKISKQRKVYYEKNRVEILQQQEGKCVCCKN